MCQCLSRLCCRHAAWKLMIFALIGFGLISIFLFEVLVASESATRNEPVSSIRSEIKFSPPKTITIMVDAIQRPETEISDCVAAISTFFCPGISNLNVRVVTINDGFSSEGATLRFHEFPSATSQRASLPDRAITILSIEQQDQNPSASAFGSMLSTHAFLLGASLWDSSDLVLFTSTRLVFVREVCQETWGSLVAAWDPIAFQRDETPNDAKFSDLLFGGTPEEMTALLLSVEQALRESDAGPTVTQQTMRRVLSEKLAARSPTVTLPPSFVWPAPPTDVVPMTDNAALRGDFLLRAQSPVALVLPIDPAAVGRSEAAVALRRMYNDVTVAIREHEQPGCLERLLASLLRRYPLLRVAVVDQSGEDLISYFMDSAHKGGVNSEQISLRHVPIAGGRAAALNAMTDMVQTRYVLMLNAEHLAVDLDLVAVHQVIESDEADIVGLNVEGELSAFRLHALPSRLQISSVLPLRDHTLPPNDNVPLPAGCVWVSMVNDAFMARTTALQQVRWDTELGSAEQEDFFLRAFESEQLQVAACDGPGYRLLRHEQSQCIVGVYGEPNGARGSDEVVRRLERLRTWSRRNRRDMVLDSWPAMMRKHGLTKVVTPEGTFSLQCDHDRCRINHAAPNAAPCTLLNS